FRHPEEDSIRSLVREGDPTLLSLCGRDGGQSHPGGRVAARSGPGCNSPTGRDSAASSFALEVLRGLFDKTDATGVVVLFSNRRPPASSAESVAAVAVDGVAEPATISRGLLYSRPRGSMDAYQRVAEGNMAERAICSPAPSNLPFHASAFLS